MEQVLLYLQEHLAAAPWVILLLLTAAGANIPISEDIITITAALMASQNRAYAPILAVSLIFGALSGDTVAYWIGRGAGHLVLRPGVSKRRTAMRLKVETMKGYLDRRTVPVLFLGRYIPFGFRNVLHITAGLMRIPYLRYILIDIAAVLGTTNLLFWLVFWYGSRAADLMKSAEIVLLVFILIAVAAFVFWRRRWSGRAEKTPGND